jgi:hypothetical protein
MEQIGTNMESMKNQDNNYYEETKEDNQNNRRLNQKHIEWRRDKVFDLFAKGYSQAEISRILNIPKTNVCRDIQFLKKMSQEFVLDFSKELGFYYKGCLHTMDQIQQKSWDIYNNKQVSEKDKLLALKVIKEACESKFSLLEKGPSVIALKSLQERVQTIESLNNNTNES